MAESPPINELSRSDIRRLLTQIFKSAAAFEAFCLDHFGTVHFLFSTGMDRLTQTNLLLLHAEPAEVWAAIQKALGPLDASFFEQLAKNTSPLRQRDPSIEQHRVKLAALERARRMLPEDDPRVLSLSSEISLVRRDLRHGPHLNTGELVSDQYELLESIGSGSFAEVWLARDRKACDTDPPVALKVLHGSSSLDTNRRERFKQSAAILHKLQHPHIVQAYADATEWKGFYYFAMEYMEGGDLHRSINEDSSPERLRQGLDIIIQAGRALSYLHKNRIVHRDVKPSNILLDRHSRARLSDLDLVRNEDWLTDTRSGKAIGTLPFAAPEQLGGQFEVDGRADVYGLARCTLWVLCGGQLPAEAIEERTTFLNQIEMPDLLRQVLQKSTESHPANRYSDMNAFLDSFENALKACNSTLILPIKLPTQQRARTQAYDTPRIATPMGIWPRVKRQLRWLVLASLVANLGLFVAWRMLRNSIWPKAEPSLPAGGTAPTRQLGREDALPALHSGCDALSKARGQACTSAVGQFCRREGFAGGISQEIPLTSIQAGCVRGELATASFEELAHYVPTCNSMAESQSQACVTAASQYCLYMAGLTAGFIQDTDGKHAQLLCFRGQVYKIPLQAFLPANPRCNEASLSQHPFCLSAAHTYCAARKKSDGIFYTGGIVAKVDAEILEVACFSGALRNVFLMLP